MTQPTLTPRALSVIQDYLHIPLPLKDVSCPYYNNRRTGLKGGLRVMVGKGSIEDVVYESELLSVREKIDLKTLSNEDYKKFLVDRRIGIDCSGFAYYVLDAESVARGFGHIRQHLAHPYAKNIFRKFFNKIRPIENTGVTTFAHEKNSREIPLDRVMPGDYVVMLYTGPDKTYNHMMIVHQVDFDEQNPPQAKKLYYTHSFSWPEDGQYNHGVRQGTIEIIDPKKPLAEQVWTEQGKTSAENFTQAKAREAMYVSVRRLNWF